MALQCKHRFRLRKETVVMSLSVWSRFAKALIFGRVPNYVIAFVNGQCNMRCRSCCRAALSARKSGEMTPAQWAQALSGADALLHLTITGGEPFLRTDLKDLICAMLEASGVPRLSINTNGFHTGYITSTVLSVLERFPHVEFCLTVSVDGPRHVHDDLRGLEGAFAAARETIEQLGGHRDSYRNFSLRVASLLQPGNAAVLPAFLNETDSWPVDYHELILARDVPIETQAQLASVYSALTRRQLLRASLRHARSVDWRIDCVLRQRVLDVIQGRRRASACPAGGRMVELLPNGEVRGCEVGSVWDRSVIGNVLDSGQRLIDVVASAEAARFRQHARGCECTFECAISCDIVFRPVNWISLACPKRSLA
jgi:sulfatase maturation enzyme AslB (radical SAM superfamily)